MKIILRGHPLERMVERGVTEADIQHVLRFYSSSFATRNNSTELRAMFVNGRVLKVWIVGSVPLVEPVIIKSVAWMEIEID
jgi:hypothetical protein